jgi:hypothetical protein
MMRAVRQGGRAACTWLGKVLECLPKKLKSGRVVQIVEKAQQAGERLAKNTKRGEQLSLLNMKEEQKRNAKLLEMDQAALQVGCPST